MITLLLTVALLTQEPNVVLILADDMGVDRVAAYAEHPNPGNTPNIDRLAALGVLYRNAYTNPLCSSTRAAILTGRYGFRTGITSVIFGTSPTELDPTEDLIGQQLLGYTRQFIGKWHLGNDLDHPNLAGISDFRGTQGNFEDYEDWAKNTNGTLSQVQEYAVTHQVDEAVLFMQTTQTPFFLQVFTHTPHRPFHTPPGFPYSSHPPTQVRNAIEALDTEIGRILLALPPNTFVIFTTDNGTDRDATDAPFISDHAKGSLYEGGVNVPLIVFGPGVPRNEECASLINLSDLYATIGELTNSTMAPAEDSISFAPTIFDPTIDDHRDWVFAERNNNNTVDNRMILGRTQGSTWKLIEDNLTGGLELYDLETDPWELTNLINSSIRARRAERWLEDRWPE